MIRDLVKADLLKPDQIEREADGTVVVVNGYERKPIGEWAKTLPSWVQKAPKPVGSGAPSGRSVGGDIPPGTKNPFAKESYNLTEQSRLYRTDRDMYEEVESCCKPLICFQQGKAVREPRVMPTP